MKILIKNGWIHQFKNERSTFAKKDLLIENTKILKIEENMEVSDTDREIDASDCLVMPGLVNSHLHTYCHYVKGCFDNMPLDMWMLHTRPFFSGKSETPEDVYARTLFGCIELLKNGTTLILDDMSFTPALRGELYDAAMQAYKDAGIRADVTVDVVNLPGYKCLPYLEKELPEEIKGKMDAAIPNEEKIISYMQEKLEKYNKEGALVRCILAPSAPQRCTVSLMKKIRDLSEQYCVPVITHLLETPVQKELGYLFHGKSLTRWMDENDLLYPNLNLMHTVWLEDEDMKLVAKRGCKTVHNPGSNLKLGSGIAPVEKLLEAGITVGLGTDNTSCSDTLNLFEEIKLAGLLHKVGTVDYHKWIGAHEAIRMATYNGAVCDLREKELGSLEEGKLADIIILDTMNERFTPANDYVNQLVFSENGRSVRDVIINGHFVVENGEIVTFDEKKALANFKKVLREDIDWQKEVAEKEAAIMEPAYEAMYFKTLSKYE